MKWLFAVPLIVCVVAAALLALAAQANNAWRVRWPDQGFADIAFRSVAPEASLAAPSAYLSAKQIAAGRRLDAPQRLTGTKQTAQAELAAAYLCQLDPQCARDAETRSGVFVLTRAELFLLGASKKGADSAGADACLLPWLTGARFQPVSMARRACAAAADAGSAPARSLLASLDASPLVSAARIIEWTSSALCLDGPAHVCRLTDAPAKLASAVQWNYYRAIFRISRMSAAPEALRNVAITKRREL